MSGIFKKHMPALNGSGVYTDRESWAIAHQDQAMYMEEMQKQLKRQQRELEQSKRALLSRIFD